MLPLYRYRVTGTASCSLPGWGSEPADQVATGGSACDNGTAVQPSSWAKRRKDRSSETSLHPDAPLRPPHSLTRNRVTSPAVTPAHPVPPAGTAEPTNKPATAACQADLPRRQPALAYQVLPVPLEQRLRRPGWRRAHGQRKRRPGR